jgi:uncharacterized protein YerC
MILRCIVVEIIMTKLSRKSLGDDKLGHLVNELWSAFTLMDSKEDIRLLFKDMFTHTEYKMLAKRLAIARLLLEDKNYDSIRESINVTPGTISHVSNILAAKGSGYRKAHLKLKGVEKKHHKKVVEHQDRLERRARRKMPAETFLADAFVAGAGAVKKSVSKKIKKLSASRKLSL